MFDQAAKSHQAYEAEKDNLIDELIRYGHTKLDDGRQLYELSLKELQEEMRKLELQKGVVSS